MITPSFIHSRNSELFYSTKVHAQKTILLLTTSARKLVKDTFAKAFLLFLTGVSSVSCVFMDSGLDKQRIL